jgi:hypothetical protein
MSRTDPSLRIRKLISAKLLCFAEARSQRWYTCVTIFRRYSGNGNAKPGVLIVATSLPVLGVSPGAGSAGAAVLGEGSRSGSAGAGDFGVGAGGFAFGGLGVTGAGFSFGAGVVLAGTGAGFSSGGGLGNASGASRFVEGAGAATRSTAYEGGDALDGLTVVKRKLTAAA